MHSYLLLGWITILVLASGFQTGNLQDGEALLCTDPVRLEIGAGQIETLQILLVNADAAYGIDLQATFDPAVVQVVDADPGQTGVQMLSGAFLKSDFTVRNMADNAAGTLRYVVTQLKPTPAASGKGIILSVQFRGKTLGSSSKLTFTSAVIADRRGNKQPLTSQGADLIIVSPKPSTPAPHPSRTSTPTMPPSLTATLTRTKSQPTAQPSTISTMNNAPTQPEATANQTDLPERPVATTARKDPADAPGSDRAVSGRVLTYVTVCGFSGAILLFGLTVGLLAAKHHKERSGKSK